MRTNRIPIELQAVFVASNQCQEVHKPPPSKAAFKVFRTVVGDLTKKLLKGKKRYPRSNSLSSQSTFPSADASSLAWDSSPQIEESCPQGWIEAFLAPRGYNTNRYNTVETAYFNRPTPLQMASYNVRSVQLSTCVDKEELLREMLSCGISSHACNIHGESLMHKACRLGYHQVLRVFLEFEPELKFCDSQGRTLLHDCCWGARPSFQVFSLLIQKEPELLFMADCRGACPLEYVQKDHYSFWIDFLEHNAERFWPRLDSHPREPAFVKEEPNTRPIAEPCNALTCELAALVATGRMKPNEAVMMMTLSEEDEDCEESTSTCDIENSSVDEMDSDCSESSFDADSESSSAVEEDEKLLEELGAFLSVKH